MKIIQTISLAALLLIINQSILKSQSCETCDPQIAGVGFALESEGCIQEVETTTLNVAWSLGGSSGACVTPPGSWGIEVNLPLSGEYGVLGASSADGPQFDWTYDNGAKKLTGITNTDIAWLSSGTVEIEITGMSMTSCMLVSTVANIIIVDAADGGCAEMNNMPGNDSNDAGMGVEELTDLCVDRNCDPQLTGMEFDLECVQEDKTAVMLLGWNLGGGDPGCTTPPGSWAIQISLPSDEVYHVVDASTTEGVEFDWTYDAANKTLNGLVNRQLQWLNSGTIEVTLSGVTSTDCALTLSNANIQIIPNDLGGCLDAFANQPGNDSNSAGLGVEPFAPADLTPILQVLPSIAEGPTDMLWTIRVQELADELTEGNITVVLPKDPRLGFAWDPTETNIAGIIAVDNPDWVYDGSNGSFHIWTSDTRIAGMESSTIGFEAIYDPLNTNGQVPYTVTIIGGSGAEVNDQNNIDAESISYFSN